MAQFEKAFKHKTVKHFKVGPFIFVDSVLVIKDDDEQKFNDKLAQFEKLWQGLHPSDKNAIRSLKAVSNEEDVSDGIRRSLAVRGVVGTKDIADRPIGDAATLAANAQTGDAADPANATQAPVTPAAPKLSQFRVG